jgi:hypothetical protein
VLVASTPHTGSASVVLPMVGTTHARVKIEAVDNVFFDVSNADFAQVADPSSPGARRPRAPAPLASRT